MRQWRKVLSSIALGILLFSAKPTPVRAAENRSARVTLSADSNWRFYLGDASGAEVPTSPTLRGDNWTSHTTGASRAAGKDNPTGAGEGFFPAGIGWYRKTFNAPAEWQAKRERRVRRGVPRRDRVLERENSGSSPTDTPASLRPDESAELHRPQHAGSARGQLRATKQPLVQRVGIYRHVRFVVTEPTHVAHWGVFVTTPKAIGCVGNGQSADDRSQTRSDRTRRDSRDHDVRSRPGKKRFTNESTLTSLRARKQKRRKRSRSTDLPCGRLHRPSYTVLSLRYARWQCGRRSGDDAVRHQVAVVVGGKGAAAQRQASQADGRKRPSRQRPARRSGI